MPSTDSLNNIKEKYNLRRKILPLLYLLLVETIKGVGDDNFVDRGIAEVFNSLDCSDQEKLSLENKEIKSKNEGDIREQILLIPKAY